MTDPRLQEALRHFDPASGVKLWHGGATVLGSLRGVNARVAAWKPAPDRHNIWEFALHIAYWNYAVRRRITAEAKGGFPRSPANWPAMPEVPNDASWKTDRELLRDEHDALVEAIRSFDSTQLDDMTDADSKTTYADLITGIVLHDVYHVGQILLMKRLAPAASGMG
jgi:uncharacterized damage-inducible protein DinB